MINPMVVSVLRIVNMIYLLYFAVSIQSLNGLTIQPCQDGECIEHTTNLPLSCLEGYYGPNCTYRCSDRCIDRSCEISDTGVGVCTVGCIQGYWGVNCRSECASVCDGCNRETGVCTACKPSAKCEEKCFDTCPSSYCKCTSLSQEPCLFGKFGSKCQWGCPEFCLGNVCNRQSGLCISGCKKGYFGSKCENKCNNNCRQGKCNLDGSCSLGCNPGFYGDFCELVCSENCRLNACDRQSGLCISGCKKGYFGSKCENKCNNNCRQGKCNLDGSCSLGCNPGFYGDFCELVCSENCRLNACDRQVGDCTSGCADGYFGPRCNRTCPGCEVCDGRTGFCLGAGAGIMSASHLILISSTVSVSIILLVAVIIIVLLYRSRSRIFSRQQYLTTVAPVTLPISVNSTYNEAYDVINEQAEVEADLSISDPDIRHASSIDETDFPQDQNPNQNPKRAIFRTL